jgi:hypothetical protein
MSAVPPGSTHVPQMVLPYPDGTREIRNTPVPPAGQSAVK